MAIFHCQIKPVTRSAGRSAVAAAAYRACEKIQDQRTGLTHDFNRKSGLVLAEIYTPDNSEISRAELWNKAEAAEVRKDARTAREYEVALPRELPESAAIACAVRFARGLARNYGCAADVAIHAHGNGDKRNLHAHILTTTRKLEHGKLTEKTVAELSDKKLRSIGAATGAEQVTRLRQAWAQIVNEAGREYGMPEISSLSLKDQGINREPPVHLGPTASAMERKGIRTRLGDENRRAKGEPVAAIETKELAALREEIEIREAANADISKAKTAMPEVAQAVKEEQEEIKRQRAAELAAERKAHRHHQGLSL